MSIFNAVKPKQEDDTQLVVRYGHLQQYADILGLADIEPLIQKAGLNDGLSTEKLNDLQIMIESAVAQADYRHQIHGGHGKTNFTITTSDDADWYFKMKVIYRAEANAVKEQYDKLLKSINANINSLDFLFEKQVEDYGWRAYEQDGKKTRVLPHGTIRIKNYANDSYAVADENGLQAWAEKLSPESKDKFGIYPKTWTRNLDVIKEACIGGSELPFMKKTEAGERLTLSVGDAKE